MNATLFMLQNKMEDNKFVSQNFSDLKKKIYPKYVLISSSGVIFVNGLYCVLLLKYFKIYSEQLINYRAADKL